MNKRIVYFFFIVVVVFLLVYFSKYTVENNNVSVESNLEYILNLKHNGEKLNPKILEMTQLNTTTSYIVLFKLDKNVYGNAHYIKGLNGKLKFEGLGYGDGLYNPSEFEIIDTNKGNYIVFYGGNPDLKIDHISVQSKDTEFDSFTSDVSKIEYFLKYKKIPDKLIRPSSANFKLLYFDTNNNLIKLK